MMKPHVAGFVKEKGSRGSWGVEGHGREAGFFLRQPGAWRVKQRDDILLLANLEDELEGERQRVLHCSGEGRRSRSGRVLQEKWIQGTLRRKDRT